MTLGEHRVRTKFNPSANSMVDQIKQKTAELIDLCEKVKEEKRANPDLDRGEVTRLCSIAQTHYEDAAMWAVKAATT